MLIGSNDYEFGLFAALVGYDSILLGTGNLAGLPMAMVNMLYACGTVVAANARYKAGVNTWRYRYAGDFPNMNITLEEGTGGSWHGAEVGLVFGTTEGASKTLDTVEEKKLSKQMREFWAAFAKDPDHGLSNLGWPLYNPDGKSFPIRN
jgi:carboxylesterase type B